MNSSRETARAVLQKNGKSFYWASWFLTRAQAQHAQRLYAFCRYIDDIADTKQSRVALPELQRVREEVLAGQSTNAAVQDMVELIGATEVNPIIITTLIDTLANDTESTVIQTWDELLRYAYGVASTVGIAMCRILNVQERKALPFAIDLGIAMQLTNIARDVVEDACHNRRYLPLPTVSPLQIANGVHNTQISATVMRVLELARVYYRSADQGMHYLPWRARLAILVASRVYEAIGDKRRRQISALPAERVYVTAFGKIWHTLRAACALIFDPTFWSRRRGYRHDPHLHRALSGLYGADCLQP